MFAVVILSVVMLAVVILAVVIVSVVDVTVVKVGVSLTETVGYPPTLDTSISTHLSPSSMLLTIYSIQDKYTYCLYKKLDSTRICPMTSYQIILTTSSVSIGVITKRAPGMEVA